MTYCVAIKVEEGLVALADGRLTAGTQVTTGRKITLHGEGHQFFVATSGLRSLRDKILTYLRREMERLPDGNYPSMLDAVEAFTRQMRSVAKNDQRALEESDLSFNLYALIGGKLEEDREPHVYLVYPEGNWIELDDRTPYLVIGETPYGKPVLDRALDFKTPIQVALKLAYLSFDSTRASASDVGFPIDILTWTATDERWREAHYVDEDVREQRNWWNDGITRLAREMPDGPWIDDLLPTKPLKLVAEDDRT